MAYVDPAGLYSTSSIGGFKSPVEYNNQLFERICDRVGLHWLFLDGASVMDPAESYRFRLWLKNVGKKLVRIGANKFLEPGEELTLGMDDHTFPEVVALNNGV